MKQYNTWIYWHVAPSSSKVLYCPVYLVTSCINVSSSTLTKIRMLSQQLSLLLISWNEGFILILLSIHKMYVPFIWVFLFCFFKLMSFLLIFSNSLNFQVTKAFATEDISKCFSKNISCLNNTINDGGIPSSNCTMSAVTPPLILSGEYYIHLCKWTEDSPKPYTFLLWLKLYISFLLKCVHTSFQAEIKFLISHVLLLFRWLWGLYSTIHPC